MTALGIETVSARGGEAVIRFRNGWVKHLRVALSSAGGMAVVLGLFALLEHQPADGFRLLAQWGPWPVVVLVALAILGTFLRRLSDSLQTSFGALVENAQRTAEAHRTTAAAVTRLAESTARLADQGGQSAEEVRRLAIFAAQEFPSVYERFDRTDAALGGLVSMVTALHKSIERGSNGH